MSKRSVLAGRDRRASRWITAGGLVLTFSICIADVSTSTLDPYINFRYRLENVDQDGYAKEATASTLRTRLGAKAKIRPDISATVEFENVSYIGGGSFNNTVNGKLDRPVVADPDGTELNHAYLTYNPNPRMSLIVGRQPLNVANLRYIGTVGWRQNDQSYDGVTVKSSNGDKEMQWLVSHIVNVNRIFGDNHPAGHFDTSLQVVDFRMPLGRSTGLGAYAVLADVKDADALSSQTLGIVVDHSWSLAEGTQLAASAELARQREHGENPIDYDADYYHLSASLVREAFSLTAGFEVLSADERAGVAFGTPFATLHKFNGWADKFLTTPAAGLEDAYLGFKTSVDVGYFSGNPLDINLSYHEFDAESGSADWGDEWDLSIAAKWSDHINGLVKLADYTADRHGQDTRKVWFQLMFSY